VDSPLYPVRDKLQYRTRWLRSLNPSRPPSYLLALQLLAPICWTASLILSAVAYGMHHLLTCDPRSNLKGRNRLKLRKEVL
jgi:hypothetical protein